MDFIKGVFGFQYLEASGISGSLADTMLNLDVMPYPLEDKLGIVRTAILRDIILTPCAPVFDFCEYDENRYKQDVSAEHPLVIFTNDWFIVREISNIIKYFELPDNLQKECEDAIKDGYINALDYNNNDAMYSDPKTFLINSNIRPLKASDVGYYGFANIRDESHDILREEKGFKRFPLYVKMDILKSEFYNPTIRDSDMYTPGYSCITEQDRFIDMIEKARAKNV